MNDLENLKLIDNAVSVAPLTRLDHVKVQDAIRHLHSRLDKLAELEKLEEKK